MNIAQGLIKDMDPPRHRHRATVRSTAFSGTIFRLRPRLEAMEDRTLLSTFLVSNTGDSGPGSLRQAILDSNKAVGATNTIDFDISGTGVQTIVPLSSLPAISNPVLIDGSSQPGYGSTPLIELSGSQAGGGDGLTITGAGVTVRGLDINTFISGTGIYLTGNGATGDWIYGNFVGTDPTGARAEPNGRGIGIDGSATNNLVGTNGDGINDQSERNLISGNDTYGVWISGASGNVVAGNEISNNDTVTPSLANDFAGIAIDQSSNDNTIGGATAVSGNLITNNGGAGIVVGWSLGDTLVGNQITANRIFANTGQAIDLAADGVTYNASAPRQGPNNFQNFPIIFSTADGQLEGGLWGSLPGATYRVDLFASATYNSNGSGEAEDFLGSLEVTTNSQGQATFDVPYTPPSGLPIVTATATDPQGNTSEVSALRRATLQAPSVSLRAVANHSLDFATTSGNGIAIQDPDAGSTSPSWDLTLSVSDGTLTLASTAGLTGSGDGTGSLSYTGPLAAIDTALQGMIFNPPAGPHVFATLTLGAQSYGAPPLQTQFAITDGVFVVDTTADSGPGSLRQAILDANSATGLTVTINFAIPDAGVQTIEPITPLPPITASVLIDGTTQPGFAGTALIAFGGQSPGDTDPLNVSSGNVTIRGLAIDGVSIDATADERLIAVVAAPGATSQLSLLDAQGHVLVQSDGVSSDNPDNLLDQHLTAGVYSLALDARGGKGALTWTVMLTPAASPFLPIPVAPGSNITTSPLFTALPTCSIVAGDFSGDGKLDLAVSDPAGVQILLGNGDGTFQPARTITAEVAGALVAGDFRGDGRLDLAIANQNSNDVSVLLGNGDGTFQPPVEYAVGNTAVDIVAGDFRGKGRLDLAVSDSVGVQVLLSNGDGSFQPPVTYAAGGWATPGGVVAGDFNSDGHLDLALTGSAADPVTNTVVGGVSVFLGNGDGTFRPQGAYTVGDGSVGFATPFTIVAGDFSGDGHLDLAVDDAVGVQILQGNGDGTFQPERTVAAGIQGALVASDFTRDGHLDLATTSLNYNTVSVLLGNGDGTFQPQVTYAEGTGFGGFLEVAGLVAGDFTGNGRTDLAVANGSQFYLAGDNNVSVLLGDGDGTFQSLAQARNPVGAGPQVIVAGDFTANGKLDLVVSDSVGAQILLGNGDGTFQPARTVGAGLYGALVAGDFNGDGRLDLAVTNYYSNDVSVLLGDGDGTFQPPVDYAVGNFPVSIVAGDFNGDGHLDLAVSNYGNELGSYPPGNDPGSVSVLMGNGNGTFQPAVEYSVGLAPAGLVTGDFNRDGRIDLAVTVFSSATYTPYTPDGMFNPLPPAGEVSVLLSNGDGTFQPAVQYAVGSVPNSLVAGDFNGDGKLDLAVDDTAGAQMLLGNGDGTFQAAKSFAGGSFGFVGDFNGDGKLDLATADLGSYNPSTHTYASSVSVLLGNGDGTFQPGFQYAVGAVPEGIVAGDFNGDGKLDLATANYWSNDVSVLLGDGDGTFVDPGQLVTTPHATPLVADVSGDGTDDVLVVDGAGDILYRRAIPGQPGTFEPPATVNPNNPSRDIAWLPNTDQRPVLASVDAEDDAISFYAYRDGGFVRLIGSLTTGPLPAQIVSADLNGDGLTDLVVRNAGDGTLSVSLGCQQINSKFVGPLGALDPPTFRPTVTVPVGLGVSDIQAVDTTGSGELDLVVTNKLTGQVSILRNLGDGTFAPPVPYRAGTGLSEIDPGSTPELTTLEATAGVAAGSFTTGGPTGLVTINPGSNTLDVLVGLGGGRFANPVTLQTASPALVVRVGDFTGNGIDDLAVLTTTDVSIYLGNGKGGFLPPISYDVPPESDGLTVAGVTGDGKLDLLVGDAYGDVLVLLGEGDGTFQPYHQANQSIELAVTDLTGNGSNDIIYADQRLDRVVVDYGTGNSTVLANQSTGLLDPGAVKLADLNGDGVPDLIVANSGSNNVLIFPGLGNGQFGPAINGDNGYFVGTNPVGITVANLSGNPGTPSYNPDALPDLVIADKGSNEVSILLNQSQKSGPISFKAGPRLNSGGVGPVTTVVGNFTGGDYPDLLVTNSQSNDVKLLPGVGQGFFNDVNPAGFSVGSDPGPTFVGDFNGQTGLVTVNAGSNDLTLISGFEQPGYVTSTIASGGVNPDAAFVFSDGTGFENLVVGNAGDGVLSLFEGGTDGLDLTSATTEPNLPDPTALAFSALTSGQVQFYAATAGRESAELVALSLGIETALISSSPGLPPANPMAQLVPLHDSSLPLVATVLTLTISVSGEELNFDLVATEATAVAAFLPGTGISVGQGLSSQGRGGPGNDDGTESDESAAGVAVAAPAASSPWERYVIGLDEALEKFQREHPTGISGAPARDSTSDRPQSPPAAGLPSQSGPTSWKSGSDPVPSGDELDQTENASPSPGVEAIDAIIESVWGKDRADDSRERLSEMGWRSGRSHDVLSAIRLAVSPSPRSELPLAGSDRRTGELLPPVPETGKDQPDLALTSLVVATMATECVHACRWHRNVRPSWPGKVGHPVRRRRAVIK
jgi:hypothetical protein